MNSLKDALRWLAIIPAAFVAVILARLFMSFGMDSVFRWGMGADINEDIGFGGHGLTGAVFVALRSAISGAAAVFTIAHVAPHFKWHVAAACAGVWYFCWLTFGGLGVFALSQDESFSGFDTVRSALRVVLEIFPGAIVTCMLLLDRDQSMFHRETPSRPAVTGSTDCDTK